MIHDRVEEQNESDNEFGLEPAAMALLAGPDGPLERMKATMEEIVLKLAPQARFRRLAQPFRWPFEKKDILELFGTTERLKSHFTLVLQNDLLTISKLTSEKVQKKGTRPMTKQLSQVFAKLFSSCDNIFIVIDALDECASSDMEAVELVGALQGLGDNVRILLTSRTSTNFEGFFKDAVRIDIKAKDEDVRLYLERKIPKHFRLAKHVCADPKLQDDIITSIAESAQGMFLLATLNLDSLSRKLTRRDVRSSLSILPKTLDATYKQALERIRTQAEEDVELAEMVILWILCARRPLGIHELQHMYAVHLRTRDEDEDEDMILLEVDDLPPEDIVTGVCGSFIVVDSISKTVSLVHYTAQDYLSRTLGKHLDKTRLELARISLEYLQLLNFQEGPALSDSVMAERLANFPFLDYAARYWGADLQGLQVEDLWGSVNRFLSNAGAISVASQIWSLPRYRYAHWSNEYPKGFPGIVLAASFQIPNVLERLVGQGKDIEGRGSDKKTPLIRSARLGHEENIKALIQLGADVAATDIAGETAIDVAALAGKASLVEALIDGVANWQYQDCTAADRIRS
ncbi:Ankyrin [Colletotrichum higginsianum IMI 349063]|uniref:Ankyrin n=2 Tax=Colletotrichum higginsianum TaxID=80884 RepID=A0A1B7Y7Y3_COLHI|nr:Ankyrin [Colletotrichum higginsianum IMI 349063]OBR08080.1 Ankyrin [Colletotrichum higginsianum IMI 349063]